MNKQTIIITLEEYKILRDVLEDYQKLLSEYNLLSYIYNGMITPPPQPEVEKPKCSMGFIK